MLLDELMRGPPDQAATELVLMGQSTGCQDIVRCIWRMQEGAESMVTVTNFATCCECLQQG